MEKPDLIDKKTWDSVVEMNDRFRIAFEIELESDSEIESDYSSTDNNAAKRWLSTLLEDKRLFKQTIVSQSILLHFASTHPVAFDRWEIPLFIPYFFAIMEEPSYKGQISDDQINTFVEFITFVDREYPDALFWFAKMATVGNCHFCRSECCEHVLFSKRIRERLLSISKEPWFSSELRDFLLQVANEALYDLNGALIYVDYGSDLGLYEYSPGFPFAESNLGQVIYIHKISDRPKIGNIIHILNSIFVLWNKKFASNEFVSSMDENKHCTRLWHSFAHNVKENIDEFIDELQDLAYDELKYCYSNDEIPECISILHSDYHFQHSESTSWKACLKDNLPNFWNKWKNDIAFSPENSIESGYGFEIKHNTYHSSLKQAVEFLQDFYSDFDKQNYLSFSCNTGLHINISMRNEDGSVVLIPNPLKGYLFINTDFIFVDNQVRSGTRWAQHPVPQYGQILKILKKENIGPYTKFKRLEIVLSQEIQKQFDLLGSKACGFNFLYLKNSNSDQRRIEFRFPGNDIPFDALYRQLIYFCFIARHVYDPNFQRLRYIGKVFSFIDKDTPPENKLSKVR